MGSPLGPVLDNLFMGFYEKQWLKEFNFCKILLYHSYVDDIICLFNCEVDAMKFFDYLNSRNSNIKFTFEKQNRSKLAFLDILISNENDNFCTSVFRKKKHQLVSTLTSPDSPLFSPLCRSSRFLQYTSGLEVLACSLNTDINYWLLCSNCTFP